MDFKSLALVGALAFAGTANANILWNQPFDGTGNAYSSQNDTTGGNGNFATAYDNFTLGSSANLTEVTVVGEYFNPPSPGPITNWTLGIYADNAGQPGSLLATGSFANNETFLGNFAGFPTYTYDFAFSPYPVSAGTYWLSVVPDLGFPPQWGWSGGTGGDGVSYQDFFGTRGQLATDLAFTVSGTAVPEPGAWVLMLVGFGGLGLAMRSRRKACAATA